MTEDLLDPYQFLYREEIREYTKSIETDLVYVKIIRILIHIILYILIR